MNSRSHLILYKSSLSIVKKHKVDTNETGNMLKNITDTDGKYSELCEIRGYHIGVD